MFSRRGRMLLAIRKQSGGVGVNIISRRSFSSGVVYAGKHVAPAAGGRRPPRPHQPPTVLGLYFIHKQISLRRFPQRRRITNESEERQYY